MLFDLMNSATVWSASAAAVAVGFFEVDVSDDFDDVELLDDVVVFVSDPQPDNTTARAVTAAAAPVSADVLIVLELLSSQAIRG